MQAKSYPTAILVPLAVVACVIPTHIALSISPSATLFNQLAAIAAWGVLAAMLSARASLGSGGFAALMALGVMLLASGLSAVWYQQPVSLVMESVGMLVAATVCFLGGIAARDQIKNVVVAISIGMVLAGLLSFVLSLLQVYFPQFTDGDWIAHSGVVGRAVGNMRQPNHLSSLLLWSCIASVALAELTRLPRGLLWALLAMFVFGVVLSASRTGLIGIVILALWGLADQFFDKRLSGISRLALVATIAMLAASMGLEHLWADAGVSQFGAASRLTSEGAGSPSRIAILSNAWALLKANPLSGVGWGEFNLAWTLTPFPDRPIAFFDHTHNIVMQWLVEMGVPMGGLVLVLLSYAIVKAFVQTGQTDGETGVALRAAFMMVIMIGLHSLLEYPLWYAYFLMPTAMLLGICLSAEAINEKPLLTMPAWTLQVGGFVLVAGSAFALYDYLQVASIFQAEDGAPPLEERIARGQRSPFFSVHADYAGATSYDPSAQTLQAAQKTGHNLIDARLMMAWAKSLHVTGQTDKARFLVQRLREFRNAEAKEFLAECEGASTPKPFQCEPPQQFWKPSDFRR